MTLCPNCKKELQELDENILENTIELQGEINATEYTCPHCETTLRVFIRVDSVEVMEG